MSQVSAMDSPREHESEQESMLDMIRRIGDLATEQVRQEIQSSALDPKETSEKTSHALQMEQVAQSVLRNGKASTIEEARKMLDEAI
jgi:hypothetical protein